MKRCIISLALFAMSIIGVMAQGDPIWFHFGPNYLCYSYPLGTGGYVEEVISFNQGTLTHICFHKHINCYIYSKVNIKIDGLYSKCGLF